MDGRFLVATLVIFLAMSLTESISGSQRRFILDSVLKNAISEKYSREECILCICFKECHAGRFILSEKDLCKINHHFDCAHEDRCTCCNGVEACLNGGTCHNDDRGHFHCICPQGVNGTHCEYRASPQMTIDHCAGSPCLNLGTCINMQDTFSCRCTPGWTGRDCNAEIHPTTASPQTNKDYCAPHPCFNLGTCINHPDRFECQCKAGWTGETCEAKNPVSQYTTVTVFPQTNVNQHNTVSPQNPVNHCAVNPCFNDGTCIQLPDSFSCQCKTGWTGEDCNTDINECLLKNRCQNGGTCVNSPGGYTCNCMNGFTGGHCETIDNYCLWMTPCQHGGTCEYKQGTVTCYCMNGWTGGQCQSDIDECSASNPCQNSGTCNNTKGDYKCLCSGGWTGHNCETDVDECNTRNICQNNGTCTNVPGSYLCGCSKGWIGEKCQSDINECSTTHPCQNGGTCNNTDGDYKCLCSSGWTGHDCQTDIDECRHLNICQNNGNCTNVPGSYMCGCSNGWTGDTCQTDIDECLSSNPCQHGGNCTNTAGNYNCICPSSWTGVNCQTDVDECSLYHPCDNGGSCINTPGHYSCHCSSGWTGDNCQTDVDECLPPLDTCKNNGSCINVPGSFMCVCSNGWTGDTCQTDIDECLTVNRCQNNGICTNTAGSFHCHCANGWTGEYCQADVDECLLLNTCKNNGSCTNVPGSYTCNCSNEWTGDTCQTDIDECLSVKACQNNGTCTNTAGNFNCHCENGWTGKYCQADVDECSLYNPCGNGGTCTNSIGNYNCHCVNGWSGDKCQIGSKQNNFGICNFDDGNMCTWTQSNQDSFDWTLQSGPTLTDGTGPNNDHTLNTSQGKYLFIETSAPRLAGEEASLLSPELPSDHTVCLEFWYYMFGDGIGSLQVHAQDTHSTNNILLFKKDGNQGESWIKASVTILNKQIPNSCRLVITGNVGLTYTGDTAIDDLALNDGACEDSMTTSTHAAPPSSGSTTAVTNLETSTFVSLTGAHTKYIQHTSPTLAGQWSEWFSSKCSASCGTGTQHRLRICNAGYCIGPSSDLIPCNELNCTKQEQFPKCNHTCSLNPVIHSTAVLSNGVNCPTNGYGSNDALPLTCCNIYTREKWINGTKIEATGSCIDGKIPPYTPVSAFNAGVPTTDKAGIFYGCILNGVSGFMMIRQTCSTLPQLVSITGTEAQNYFVINFRSISALN